MAKKQSYGDWCNATIGPLFKSKTLPYIDEVVPEIGDMDCNPCDPVSCDCDGIASQVWYEQTILPAQVYEDFADDVISTAFFNEPKVPSLSSIVTSAEKDKLIHEDYIGAVSQLIANEWYPESV